MLFLSVNSFLVSLSLAFSPPLFTNKWVGPHCRRGSPAFFAQSSLHCRRAPLQSSEFWGSGFATPHLVLLQNSIKLARVLADSGIRLPIRDHQYLFWYLAEPLLFPPQFVVENHSRLLPGYRHATSQWPPMETTLSETRQVTSPTRDQPGIAKVWNLKLFFSLNQSNVCPQW